MSRQGKSTGYAFGLTSPRDFLEKALREVKRPEEATAQAYPTADAQELTTTRRC